MKCQTCNRTWKHDSEQAIAVELLGSCMNCKRFSMSSSELNSILTEQKKRKASYLGGKQ